MWFDKQSYLQTFHRDFVKLIQDNGWSNTLKYRITDGVSKYIEVKIFESLGSDNELRKFGMVLSYDTANTDFNDNRYIANNSPLGALGIGDGVNKIFNIECYPIVGSTLVVYKDGVPIPESQYTVNAETGRIEFTVAPAEGDRLSCEYQLARTAHEPDNGFSIFTFDRYTIEREVKRSDDEAFLGNGDGQEVTFNLAHEHIDETRINVYRGGTLVPAGEYTLDASKGTITFAEAPAEGVDIEASYTYFIYPDVDGNIDEIIVSSEQIDPHNVNKNIETVYSTINFHQASPPMHLSFNPDKGYTNEWKRDSIIYFYGNINKDRIVMFLRIDPTGNPVNAYFVPLYLGKIHTLGLKPRRNFALIGGCRSGDEFKWSKDKAIGDSIVDHGVETSSGNKVASLQQSYSGAMYQNHYFAFITHDKEVDNGQGRYNPSMYSNKYHLSQIFLVHPNDGYVGKLDDVYAVHPKNIQQADELEIVKSVTNEEVGNGDGLEKIFHLEHKPKEGTLVVEVDCVPVAETEYTFDPELKQLVFNEPPVGEILAHYDFEQLYRYSLPTTPISPFTQDVATPFNPIGLAIYKEDLVQEEAPTDTQGTTQETSDEPVV